MRGLRIIARVYRMCHGRKRDERLSYNFGRLVCQSVARSSIRAARSSLGSLKVGPSNCNPMGSGFSPDVNPHGNEMPAIPAMLQVTVNTSQRYIASGSPVFSPALKAAVGLVGQRTTSHFLNAS